MFEPVLAQLAVVAAFVTKVTDLVKPLYQNFEYQKYVDLAISIGVSVGLCIAWGVDALAVAGIVFPAAPWVGAAVTGVVAGLGSNVLHEIIALLQMWKDQKKSEAKIAKDFAN